MKIYGYSNQALAAGQTQPSDLAEITIAADPNELRLIAAFLLSAADEMQSMGAKYSHEHLSDKQPSFGNSPQFIVFNSAGLG
jgi:hypothetical protein